MARIVVAGYMVRLPFVGNMLAYAQYVVGLQRLGHEVVYIEESGWPGSCFDPVRNVYGEDPSVGIARSRELIEQLGAGPLNLLYHHRETAQTFGGSTAQLMDMIDRADLLLNVGGVCWLEAFGRIPCRALIDLDPMFTQAGLFSKEGFGHYTTCFTYGTQVGQPGCSVPSMGVDWIATVPPVLTDFWSSAVEATGPVSPHLTTIANWSAYGGVDYQGEHYGQKDSQFEAVCSLPAKINVPLTLRVSGMPRDTAARFRAAGWHIEPPGELNHSLAAYRSFIAHSLGEFSVAKHGYVKSRCGWISDRSVCYLASGCPIVVQDTGDSGFREAHEGVLLFEDVEDAAERIDQLQAARQDHQVAAMKIAKQRFDSAIVLPRLIEMALA